MGFFNGKLVIDERIIFTPYVLSRFGAVTPYLPVYDDGANGWDFSRLLVGITVGIRSVF